MSEDSKRQPTPESGRERQGGPDHAHVNKESRAENSNRGSNRDRSSGDSGPAGSAGNHSTGGPSGVPGGAVSADSEREFPGGPISKSGRAGSVSAIDESVKIETSRFGAITVPADKLISLPLGIPGFPDARTFCLLDHRPGSMFRWLQSIESPDLAFVVVDPLLVDPQYPMEMVRRGLNFLRLDENEELIVLGICTVPPPPDRPTLNMMAPIGIGLTSLRGAQVVLHDSRYHSRHDVIPQSSDASQNHGDEQEEQADQQKEA